MSEKTDGTLAGIVARLESLERVARNRGSLACDHLAGRIANIRGELQQIAQPQPPADAQAQGGGDMTECGHSKYDPCHNCEPLDAPVEVVAWMRRWAFDRVDVMAMPKANRPRGWNLLAVTEAKCMPDDVPLAPPIAPVGVHL